MARFPYYKHNIQELGRLLVRARMDPEFRKLFIDDPKKQLRLTGLPENVIELMDFKIIDKPEGTVSVIPYKLNQTSLENQDPNYLHGLADLFAEADEAKNRNKSNN